MWGVRRTMAAVCGVVVKGVTLVVTDEDRGLPSEFEGLVRRVATATTLSEFERWIESPKGERKYTNVVLKR